MIGFPARCTESMEYHHDHDLTSGTNPRYGAGPALHTIAGPPNSTNPRCLMFISHLRAGAWSKGPTADAPSLPRDTDKRKTGFTPCQTHRPREKVCGDCAEETAGPMGSSCSEVDDLMCLSAGGSRKARLGFAGWEWRSSVRIS